MQGKIKRLEARDQKQARGMDTQAMIPVLAMVAELVSMLGFRWVSVPDLRYSPYAKAGMLGKLEETAKGIAWNYQVPEAMTQAADQAAGYLRIGMAVSVILGLCFILLAYRVKVKAKRLGRLAFLWNTGMTVAVLWWATDTNMALNLLEGRENNFMNLTIYSHVQLTAAAYLQIVLALLIVPFLGKLLDTRKEYAAEYYQTRIETKDTGIGKRTILAFALILTAIPAVIFFGIFFLNDRSDYFISLCIIILSMLPFFLVFENRRPQAREVVVIAVMAALAVAGRAAFFMLPQFKPTAAIVIIAGVGLGAEAGFLTGALAGFVNGFFGAGGGMVLVPLLIWLCRLEDKAAFSSAIAVILPLCIVSIVVYALHDSLPISDALPYLIGGAAGGILAGLLFRKMPARALHLILGGVILAGGIRLIVC